METVYRNRDERLGENCLFTLPIMRECYRANGWDNGMTDDEIDADVLSHDVEFVGEICGRDRPRSTYPVQWPARYEFTEED